MSTKIHQPSSVLITLCSLVVLLRSYPWHRKGSKELWCHPSSSHSALKLDKAEVQLKRGTNHHFCVGTRHKKSHNSTSWTQPYIWVHSFYFPYIWVLSFYKYFRENGTELNLWQPPDLFTLSIALEMSGSNYFAKVHSPEWRWRTLNAFQLVNNSWEGGEVQLWMTEREMHKALGSAAAISDGHHGTKGMLSIPKTEIPWGEMEKAQLYSLTELLPEAGRKSCSFYCPEQCPGQQPVPGAEQSWHCQHSQGSPSPSTASHRRGSSSFRTLLVRQQNDLLSKRICPSLLTALGFSVLYLTQALWGPQLPFISQLKVQVSKAEKDDNPRAFIIPALGIQGSAKGRTQCLAKYVQEKIHGLTFTKKSCTSQITSCFQLSAYV